jgi:hypothetical protein
MDSDLGEARQRRGGRYMEEASMTLEPYERYALINERLGLFELDLYLTPAELEEQNRIFRADGVEMHFYRWSEVEA